MPSPPFKRRGVEDLAITQMLRRLAADPLAVDEATVTTALTSMHVGEIETAEDRHALLAGLLRTATAFVVSAEDAPGFTADLMDLSWERWDGLPPLPFPRIWIECGSPKNRGPVPFPTFGTSERYDDEDDMVDWGSGRFGIGIVGDESRWVVVGLEEDTVLDLEEWRYPWDDDAQTQIRVETLTADASSHYPFTKDAEERERIVQQTGIDPLVGAMNAHFAISLVQIIDVLGARHVQLDVPRPHRRAHERRFGLSHPQVYFVDLRQVGEKKAGTGGHQYNHRWLVRGHWRHLPSGRRTWVRPYVKGPVGAPWRGRPVYVSR
jgi:hypothetical protein